MDWFVDPKEMDKVGEEYPLILVDIRKDLLEPLKYHEILELVRATRKDIANARRGLKAEQQIMDWCYEHCTDYYSLTKYEACFVSSEDAVMFKLVWG